jgi:aryl-alcohol dehydrogenase-like predicted oxidoreductase
MTLPHRLGGAFTPTGTRLVLNRMGYGAMQLTGPMAFGPPRNHQAALAVLREAVRLGINHIDTSDYYGPHIANEIIREAIHPYPKDLVIVTRSAPSAGRTSPGPWHSRARNSQARHRTTCTISAWTCLRSSIYVSVTDWVPIRVPSKRH